MVTQPVGARTKELKMRSPRHILHAFAPVGSEPELVFEKGNGVILTDSDGKEYIDMSSVFACTSLGYGDKRLINTITKQLEQLSFMVPVALMSHVPAIEFAEALSDFAPESINHFFFCNSGSEATNTAISIAKAYWHYLGKSSKFKVICLMEGYHGLAGFVLSLLPDGQLKTPFGPDPAGIVRIPNYNCYRCHLKMEYPDCGIACAHYLEEAIEEEGEDSIAAFIAEPVHGYSGLITPPPEYWPIVREICTRRNVLMIDDEVVTGFCRTGKNFAVDHWNVQPDLMCMAKGMGGVYFPLAGVGVSDQVYAPLVDNVLMVGFTTGGHPAACALGKAALDIYIKDKMCEHVTEIGTHIQQRFDQEFLSLPNVGYAGGLGLLKVIEVVADKETKRRFPLEMDVMHNVVLQKCLESGIFLRIYGTRRHDRMSVSPPLIVTKEEVDRALDRLYPILAGLKEIKA